MHTQAYWIRHFFARNLSQCFKSRKRHKARYIWGQLSTEFFMRLFETTHFSGDTLASNYKRFSAGRSQREEQGVLCVFVTIILYCSNPNYIVFGLRTSFTLFSCKKKKTANKLNLYLFLCRAVPYLFYCKLLSKQTPLQLGVDIL